MPVNPDSNIEVTAFDWVPDFARGFVRDLRPRWACEEIGLDYAEHLISAINRPADHFLFRSEEHTSELQSLMRISYAVFCLKKKKYIQYHLQNENQSRTRK